MPSGTTRFAVLAATKQANGSPPGWQELAEVLLYDVNGANIASFASTITYGAGSSSSAVSILTDGQWHGTGGAMAVWTGYSSFDGLRLVEFEFAAPQIIVSAEIRSTNDQSMGSDPKIQTSQDGVTWADLLSTVQGKGLTVIYDADSTRFPASGNTPLPLTSAGDNVMRLAYHAQA